MEKSYLPLRTRSDPDDYGDDHQISKDIRASRLFSLQKSLIFVLALTNVSTVTYLASRSTHGHQAPAKVSGSDESAVVEPLPEVYHQFH